MATDPSPAGGVPNVRFARVGEAGRERPVVLTASGDAFDLRPITDDLHGGFWAAGVNATREALAQGALRSVDVSSERFGAPIARPGAVICIGMNYAAHAAESGSAPPSEPVVFFKHPNTIAGPNDDCPVPPGARKVDWEVELAVVIGARARYLASPDAALACVGAYAVSNDLSEREFQLERSGGQWSKGKCCEAFNPMGPYAVPADAIGDPQALRLRSSVNGEPRQDSSTADMIFGVAQLVWHLSHFMVLEPGDVVNTGTPEGVALSGRFPYLHAGDRVRCEIERLGATDQAVTRASVP